jgi:hypothetical protein
MTRRRVETKSPGQEQRSLDELLRWARAESNKAEGALENDDWPRAVSLMRLVRARLVAAGVIALADHPTGDDVNGNLGTEEALDLLHLMDEVDELTAARFEATGTGSAPPPVDLV